MVDSGAHTFQKEGKDTDYDEFVFEYVQWLKQYPEVDEYVELDIENKVGLKQVEKWREYMIKELGKPPIVVWHRERGKDYWLYMVKTYPYVGFSGFVEVSGEPEVPDEYVGWFIKTAHDHGAKVHGFGYTRPVWLKKYPFDSVDSSSWLISVRYGYYWIFRDGDLVCYNYSRKKGYTQTNHVYRLRQSARAWVEYQYFLEKYWQAKGGMNNAN